jgi:hypothetical protein
MSAYIHFSLLDTIFNKVISVLKSLKENHLTSLTSHRAKANNRILELNQTVQQNKEILKSNNVEKVINYGSNIQRYRGMPPDVTIKLPSLKTNVIQERELSLELEDFRVTLEQMPFSTLSSDISETSTRELLDKAREIVILPTKFKPLYHIACMGVDDVWTGGQNKTIKRLDGAGSVLDTVTTTCQYWPNGISYQTGRAGIQ